MKKFNLVLLQTTLIFTILFALGMVNSVSASGYAEDNGYTVEKLSFPGLSFPTDKADVVFRNEIFDEIFVFKNNSNRVYAVGDSELSRQTKTLVELPGELPLQGQFRSIVINPSTGTMFLIVGGWTDQDSVDFFSAVLSVDANGFGDIVYYVENVNLSEITYQQDSYYEGVIIAGMNPELLGDDGGLYHIALLSEDGSITQYGKTLPSLPLNITITSMLVLEDRMDLSFRYVQRTLGDPYNSLLSYYFETEDWVWGNMNMFTLDPGDTDYMFDHDGERVVLAGVGGIMSTRDFENWDTLAGHYGASVDGHAVFGDYVILQNLREVRYPGAHSDNFAGLSLYRAGVFTKFTQAIGYVSSVTVSGDVVYVAGAEMVGGVDTDGGVAVISKAETPTGVRDVSALETQIKVYPTLAAETLRVEGIPSEVETITVVNLLGVIESEIQVNPFVSTTVQIDVSGLPSGIYLLRVGDRTTKKFKKT